jgi:hypothetical protein
MLFEATSPFELMAKGWELRRTDAAARRGSGGILPAVLEFQEKRGAGGMPALLKPPHRCFGMSGKLNHNPPA